MFERMDARVRAGPRSMRSTGYRDGFVVPASVRHNGLWLLSPERESDSRAQRTKALDSRFGLGEQLTKDPRASCKSQTRRDAYTHRQ